MGDDVDRLRLSWSHKKVDLEVDPVGSFARSGGEQSQRLDVMETPRYALSFWFQAGRRDDKLSRDGSFYEVRGHEVLRVTLGLIHLPA